MVELRLGRVKCVLCLGAHADDIEIGCGGTVLHLLSVSPEVEVRWHVFSAPGDRQAEAAKSAAEFLTSARTKHVTISDFRESYFPHQWASIKDLLEQIRSQCEPDLIFTHWHGDRHQDHRVLSELSWNTFRRHLILEYEIPKYDGDLGRPNLYMPLDDRIGNRKIDTIMRSFESQAIKHWFTKDTFRSIMRLRGMECGPGTTLAEAFYARKMLLS